MLKKLLTLSLMLVLASSMVWAQGTHVLKANGELVKLKEAKSLQEALSVSKMTRLDGQKVTSHNVAKGYLDVQGTLDTLNYGLFNFGTNFGMFDGNVMMQYFVAPADLIIKAAGFSTSDDAGSANADVSVRLLKLNWTFEELAAVDAPQHIGVYPSEGDGLGGTDPFGEEATGNWVDFSEGAYPIPPWDTDEVPSITDGNVDYDLWSDGGFGWPITAELQSAGGSYQWVDMSNLGEPEVAQGEIFAVAMVHEGANPAFEDRIGFFAAGASGIPGWKYYEEGRLADGDGWWVRDYTWDFAVAVDLVGDRAPSINGYDQLPTSLDQGPFTINANITDDNPSGGAAGVASATLSYSIDDGATWMDVAMTGTEPDFSGVIPAQSPGTSIWYKINAVDVEGLEAQESSPHNFRVFEFVNTEALLVFNGFDNDTGYPQSYYFGISDYATYATLDWKHDTWAFGALTAELVAPYQNIIEITTNGPTAANDSVVAEWLAADGTRNYMIAGDEWLGSLFYGWPGTPVQTADGEFSRDILGIDIYYGDLVSASTESTPVMPVEGSALGGDLYTAYTQRQADSGFTTPMIYDPGYEIGSSIPNWIDGFAVLEDVEVDMMATDTVYTNGEIPLAGHRVLPAGNKIAFFGYDPLALTQDTENEVEYYWWGFDINSPQNKVLDWFGGLVDVKETSNIVPNEYKLSQNYPNPFNPSTKIEFSIPEKGLVTIKVFNVLGQEVAKVFSNTLNAGSYSVDFDASQLSSGMYIYSLQSGEFEISKKMMLLK